MKTDLLIIGAGPAGINAALTADAAGAKVILVDESLQPGGQLRQQTQFFSNLPKNKKKTTGTSLNNHLVESLNASNVKVLSNHAMVGSYLNGNIGVTDGLKTFEIHAKKYILATGAQEEGKIFPGWTLPGVMTAGAAQILINRELVLPGENAVIVGSNDFAFEVIKQLRICGVSIKAVVEDKDQLQSEKQDLLSDLGYITFLTNSKIELASGSGEVEHVSIRTPSGIKELEADFICISNGFTPILEPFEVMNCKFTYKEILGGWLPAYNMNFQTTNSNCYLAGNAAGITTLGPILLTGEIAAWSVLEELEFISPREAHNQKKECWEELMTLENNNVFKKRTEIIADSLLQDNWNPKSYFTELQGGQIHG